MVGARRTSSPESRLYPPFPKPNVASRLDQLSSLLLATSNIDFIIKTHPCNRNEEVFFQRTARVIECEQLVTFSCWHLLNPTAPLSLSLSLIPYFFPFTYLVWFELGSLNDYVMQVSLGIEQVQRKNSPLKF
jgi:hypothetical protein